MMAEAVVARSLLLVANQQRLTVPSFRETEFRRTQGPWAKGKRALNSVQVKLLLEQEGYRPEGLV